MNFKLEWHFFLTNSIIQMENWDDNHALEEVAFCKATKFLGLYLVGLSCPVKATTCLLYMLHYVVGEVIWKFQTSLKVFQPFQML